MKKITNIKKNEDQEDENCQHKKPKAKAREKTKTKTIKGRKNSAMKMRNKKWKN